MLPGNKRWLKLFPETGLYIGFGGLFLFLFWASKKGNYKIDQKIKRLSLYQQREQQYWCVLWQFTGNAHFRAYTGRNPVLAQVFRRITCDIFWKPVCDREHRASFRRYRCYFNNLKITAPVWFSKPTGMSELNNIILCMFSLVKWRAFKCTGSKVVVPVGLEAQTGAVCKFFEHQKGQSFILRVSKVFILSLILWNLGILT